MKLNKFKNNIIIIKFPIIIFKLFIFLKNKINRCKNINLKRERYKAISLRIRSIKEEEGETG